MGNSRTWIIFVGVVLLIGAWLRFPSINEGIPFFYNEDEGHHFNRTVNMVKSGDLNPHYWHKPSLHFYLRIPIVAASFLWGVKNGDIQSIQEIKTADQFGLARYSFSMSHPSIVKWNRAYSVAMSLMLVFLSFLIAKEISESSLVGLFASLLTAISPALIEYSGVIGVDMPMSLLCMLAVYFGLLVIKEYSDRRLFWTAVVSGLAVSTKYNALPIAFLPAFLLLLERRFTPTNIAIVLVVPPVAFLLGSPYIFSSIPLFLDQLAWEVWHYKIAGHKGHEGEPGVSQAYFYAKWFSRDGLGILAAIFGGFGILSLLRRFSKEGLAALFFPILFFALMCNQRANFERNVLVIIPFLAIFSATFLSDLLTYRKGTYLILSLILCIQPLRHALSARADRLSFVDTRTELTRWLKDTSLEGRDTAIASQLQLPQRWLSEAHADRFDADAISPLSLYLKGFGQIVLGPASSPTGYQIKDTPIKIFPGAEERQRVLKSPKISVFTLKGESFGKEDILKFLDSAESRTLVFAPADGGFRCKTPTVGEDYCWVEQRIARVSIDKLAAHPHFMGRDGFIKVSLSIMSPWPNQKVQINFDDLEVDVPVPFKGEAGKWQDLSVNLPYQEFKDSGGFIIKVSEVHSPISRGINADERRLGIAIREINLP